MVFAAFGLLSLSACGATYVPTPYTAPAQPLRQVGLIDDMLPENVMAYQVASTMSNFGLIGALIDAGVQESRRDAVNDALESISYDPEPALEAYLVAKLQEQGVTAALVPGENRAKRELLVDYPEGNGTTQAYFDLVIFNFGYVQAGGNAWRPGAAAEVRLVEAGTGRTLMQNVIAYNIPDARGGVITLPPDESFVFENREDMVTNPQRLAEGIDSALHKVADTAILLMR